MIPGCELLTYRAELKGEMFRALRKHFNEGEIGYGVVAERLGIQQWRVERMLKGEQNLRLDQLCDLARALDARFHVRLDTFAAIRDHNSQSAAVEPSQKGGGNV